MGMVKIIKKKIKGKKSLSGEGVKKCLNRCIHLKKIIFHMYVKICPFFKLLNHLRENGSYFLNAKTAKMETQ